MSRFSHSFRWLIDEDPGRVFDAWVLEPDLRGWLADEVDVEPIAGGAYRFWGRRVPGAPARSDGILLVCEPGARLVFTWAVAGSEGAVDVRISAEDGGTRVEGEHVFVDPPSGPRGAELIDDLWRILGNNLQDHLRGEPSPYRLDFGASPAEVRRTLDVAAPPARVWACLTRPELLNRWIAAMAVVDPCVDGVYSYGWRYRLGDRDVVGGPSRVLAIEPGRVLVTDWPDWRGDPDVPVQRVRWELAAEGEGTRLTLVHDGFVRPTDVSDFPWGWKGFLHQLAAVATGPD